MDVEKGLCKITGECEVMFNNYRSALLMVNKR
jgi:hypothetical protein